MNPTITSVGGQARLGEIRCRRAQDLVRSAGLAQFLLELPVPCLGLDDAHGVTAGEPSGDITLTDLQAHGLDQVAELLRNARNDFESSDVPLEAAVVFGLLVGDDEGGPRGRTWLRRTIRLLFVLCEMRLNYPGRSRRRGRRMLPPSDSVLLGPRQSDERPPSGPAFVVTVGTDATHAAGGWTRTASALSRGRYPPGDYRNRVCSDHADVLGLFALGAGGRRRTVRNTGAKLLWRVPEHVPDRVEVGW